MISKNDLMLYKPRYIMLQKAIHFSMNFAWILGGLTHTGIQNECSCMMGNGNKLPDGSLSSLRNISRHSGVAEKHSERTFAKCLAIKM